MIFAPGITGILRERDRSRTAISSWGEFSRHPNPYKKRLRQRWNEWRQWRCARQMKPGHDKIYKVLQFPRRKLDMQLLKENPLPRFLKTMETLTLLGHFVARRRNNLGLIPLALKLANSVSTLYIVGKLGWRTRIFQTGYTPESSFQPITSCYHEGKKYNPFMGNRALEKDNEGRGCRGVREKIWDLIGEIKQKAFRVETRLFISTMAAGKIMSVCVQLGWNASFYFCTRRI